MITPCEGRLAGDLGTDRNFLEATFDRSKESFRLRKQGVFWEAVLAAREPEAQQQVKRRRKIAVLDTGFDLSIQRLARAAVSESTVFEGNADRHGYHGTAVALLINEIAPAAELLLIDVWSGPFLLRKTVADALITAAAQGADIINLSLEFISDAEPREIWASDYDWLLDDIPNRETVREAVEKFLLMNEPYKTDGCKSKCAVCNALKSIPSNIAVFVAAGNTDKYACPACVRRSIGVGFHLGDYSIDIDGRVETGQSIFVPTPTLFPEVTVPQPPGFEGTSFASPLLAGLAGIVEDPIVFAEMGRLPFALGPVAMLANQITSSDDSFSEKTIAVWRLSLADFANHVPIRHRHWMHNYAETCPTCAYSMIDWYNQEIVMRLVEGATRDAIRMGEVATIVSPYSASAAGNLGEAYFRLCSIYPAGSREKNELTRLSHGQFKRAHQLAPEVDTYVERLSLLGNLESQIGDQ